jgi:Protein of unknown function (DUF3303)
MLYMVVERFKAGDPQPIGERFRRCGRLLPDGVTYHDSWIDSTGTRCFQLMESPNTALLSEWISLWVDLIDFDVVPVVPSREFWETHIPCDKGGLHRSASDRGA